MGTNVYADGDEIACKAGDGKVIAAFPDVCLSPPSPPVGPIPIPYPDTSFSKDMQSGSSTVQIQGQEVMLKDQSFYQSSPLGDEAATNGLGAGLLTGGITGKTYFVAWSMDVQFEGQNVDRHLDLTTSNHASEPGNECVPLPNASSFTPADPPPKTKLLKGKVIEFTWDSSLEVAYNRATVVEPHWKEGLAVEDGGNEKIDGSKGGKLGGSKRPGVYLISGKGGSPTATVKVNITENVNGVSGDATLYGVMGSLVMEGSCPTGAGEHTVTVTIKNVPDSIQWYKGDIGWILEVPDLSAYVGLANRSRAEVFFVLDTPASFYTQGVWTEALRFLCAKVGVVALKTAEDVAKMVTQHCHGKQGMTYDIVGGASKFLAGDSFKLMEYITVAGNICNCFDQASAIHALCGALGITLSRIWLEPFGFIKPVRLVGEGMCNNPFYPASGLPKHIKKPKDLNSEFRSSFSCHCFCEMSDKIYDACAGPETGTKSRKEYCEAAIDTATTAYKQLPSPYNHPGKYTQIQPIGAISDVV